MAKKLSELIEGVVSKNTSKGFVDDTKTGFIPDPETVETDEIPNSDEFEENEDGNDPSEDNRIIKKGIKGNVSEENEEDIEEAVDVKDVLKSVGAGKYTRGNWAKKKVAKNNALKAAQQTNEEIEEYLDYLSELDEEAIDEELSQLDEVSKKKLGAYIKAASGDQVDSAFVAGKRIGKSLDSQKKAEKTGIPSIKASYKKDADDNAESGLAHLGMATRRSKGIRLATDKLTGDAKVPAKNPVGRPRKVTTEDFDVSADIAAIFGDQGLSEEFIEKATRIYEAAIVSKANEVVSEAVEAIEASFAEEQEQFVESVEEEFDSRMEEMVDNVDRYLDKVVSEWKEENEVALRQTAQTHIAESFMSKLRDLFEEHYIEIPEDKVDVVEEQAEELDYLTDRLNEEIEKNIELKSQLEESYKGLIVSEVGSGLSESQKIKLATLAESISFVDADDFQEKVTELKEHYFAPKAKVTSIEENVAPVEGLLTEVVIKADATAKTSIDKYLGKI